MNLFFTTIGWTGVISILLAYILNINGKIEATSVTYSLLNVFGSLCIIIDSLYRGTMSIVFFNVVWLVVGLGPFFKKREKSWNQQ